nr:hypothetical protein CKG001_29510 [Bdellovibrio sp. CKG001]
MMTFALSQLNLDYIESLFYDLRFRTKPTSSTSDNIQLVLFDTKSSGELKSSMRAEHLLNALENIKSYNPRYILLDLPLEELEGSEKAKKELAQVASSIDGLFLLTNNLAVKGESSLPRLNAPYEKIPLASGPKTSDSKIFAQDNVTRRMLLAYQGIPLIHTEVARHFNPEVTALSNIKGQFEFAGSSQVFIDFHPTGTYPKTSFVDLLRSKDAAGPMGGKIVIVGNDTGLDSRDYILTPYSREITAMTTAEMHANMLDTVIRNSAIKKNSKWINILLVFLISLLTLHVVLTVKPVRGLIILGTTLLGYCTLSYLAFWLFSYWISMGTPLLAVILCYYFFIPYRLIVENRRSWEYYQKNKLLSQVEELKTNFISMMSHDLKTPIARIQGMTDVILSDNVALSAQQREAVDTIKHSSDDLLKFINAILSYGRIESQGVQLNLQSKDINNLLQEVIRKHEFLAKVKRIQIVSELEPMFPVPVDPELMKQVFSNLVENAIKYSPEDTKIMVSSEETDTKVIVQVADQGPGIPQDELQNIFMKFFRSKNVKSSPIKGSGLGLYLAKYFTELHRGSIFVESSHGNGSTFTVELPIEQGGTHA